MSEQDKKAAIDVSVATVLIGMRIPSTDKPMYDYVVSEFARSRTIASNIVRYSFRDLGKSLYTQDWTLEIIKKGGKFMTKFTPAEENPSQSQNGQTLQKPETLD
jgi:hypothetical protein